MRQRTYTVPPLPPVGYVLNEGRGFFSVVLPAARTNEITNPSAETATTGYTAGAGSLARSTTFQYHGAYSLAYTPTAATSDGFYYGTISTTSGQTRAVSCKFRGAAGVPYKLSVATTGGTDLVAYRFIATGRWQWVWVFWTETSTTTRRIYFTKNVSTSTAVYYVDGVQSEVCAAGEVWPTTYIDGDQMGLIPNQYPAPYLWNGTPHASTSTRSNQTRAGGRVVLLDRYGLRILAYAGLGLAAVANIALPFSQADGAQYQNTIRPPRSFTIAGQWDEPSFSQLQRQRAALQAALSRDRTSIPQPLVLHYQAHEDERPTGDMAQIVATYDGGLEGTTDNRHGERVNLAFTQYLPTIQAGDGGAALTVQTSVTNANYILQRSDAGAWAAMGTGSAGVVYAIAEAPDGSLYVGGNFASMGGVANTLNIAKWSGGAWSAMGTGANGIVESLAVAADGTLYAGGSFTLAGGVADTSRIAKWNGSVWSPLTTGANGTVFAVILAPDGSLYIGGSFTLAGGVADTVRIAKWNGSAWSALGTGGATGGSVIGLAVAPDGTLYAGGAFTLMGGVANTIRVAKWNGSAWSALSTGMDSSVNSMVLTFDGTLYAGGIFNTAGGVTASRMAKWNGSAWSAVGDTMSGAGGVESLALDRSGVLYAGGSFGTIGGVTYPDFVAKWNGAAWTPLDVDLPGVSSVQAIYVSDANTLTLGFSTTGTATAAGTTTATNNGSASTYPRLTIKGPTTGTSRIYQLANTTTGKAIYVNYTINAGETAFLNLSPDAISFTSDFQGNLLRTVMPGSNLADLALLPGANTISALAVDSTVTMTLDWPVRFSSVDDLTY